MYEQLLRHPGKVEFRGVVCLCQWCLRGLLGRCQGGIGFKLGIVCLFILRQFVMILEIFSFECYFPRDLLSDFEIQMRIRQRRST